MEIAPPDLAALMQSGTPHAVFDVRERGAYERGHIFRATSLPRRLIEFRLPALVTARATPIVLYDDDGRLAALAGRTVAGMGYRDVRVLAGGCAGWRAAGRPTVQGVNVPSKVFGEGVLHLGKTPQISPRELQERLEGRDDLLVLDARTPEEYARGTIPGSISVPGGELVLRIGDLVQRAQTTIVVHCGGRTRSYVGAESLRRMGLPNPVVALENGTMGWELAGLALERGADRRAPAASAASRSAAMLVANRVAAEDGIRFLTPDAVRRLWDARDRENVIVLDVRTPEEYAVGHVAGAMSVPGGQAIQTADDCIAVRGGSIVLICDGLVRSVMTAAWLRRMGYPRADVLSGGLPAWAETGGSVEQGEPAAPVAGLEAARAMTSTVPPAPLGAATVLDVDQSDVYAQRHVPGAGWLCRSRLEPSIERVVADRRASIVVTCADGRHSMLAAATLARMGYAGARVLEGGTRAWAAAGLPLESGLTRLLDEPDDIVLKPYDRGRAAMQSYLEWEEALGNDGVSPKPLFPGPAG